MSTPSFALLKEGLKFILLHFLFYTGAFQLYLRFLKRKKEIFILVYHRVRGDAEKGLGGIPQGRLREQAAYLKKHFRVYPVGELIEVLRAGKPIPRDAMALTFDDGFEDFYSQAYPVLREFDLPAMVYLVPQSVDRREPIWTEKISVMIKTTSAEQVMVNFNGARLRYSLASLEERQKTARAIKERLKKVPNRQRLECIARLEEQYGRTARMSDDECRMLNWDQIREMKANKIEFGAHTMTHPILTQMAEEEARAEIMESKNLIEARLGSPVMDFCYPNGEEGDFDEQTKRLVKDAGFRSACTAVLGGNDHRADLFELRRIYVRDEPLPFLMARLCGVVR